MSDIVKWGTLSASYAQTGSWVLVTDWTQTWHMRNVGANSNENYDTSHTIKSWYIATTMTESCYDWAVDGQTLTYRKGTYKGSTSTSKLVYYWASVEKDGYPNGGGNTTYQNVKFVDYYNGSSVNYKWASPPQTPPANTDRKSYDYGGFEIRENTGQHHNDITMSVVKTIDGVVTSFDTTSGSVVIEGQGTYILNSDGTMTKSTYLPSTAGGAGYGGGAGGDINHNGSGGAYAGGGSGILAMGSGGGGGSGWVFIYCNKCTGENTTGVIA